MRPSTALEREDRHHGRADDGHREERRPDDLLGRLGDDVRDPLGRRPLEREVTVRVLDEDDGALEEDAEVDRAHREQVGRHARVVEAHEGREQRERHHDRHGERADGRAQEDPHDDADQPDALDHVVRHRRERRVDEARAVVERHDLHAGRQDLLVDPIDDGVDLVEDVLRVLAPAQEDRALDRVDLVGARDRAPARRVVSTTVATLRTSTGVPPAARTTVLAMSRGVRR
jgi:hypothetical protein